MTAVHVVEHNKVNVIPSVLHYCWFGSKGMPSVSRRCLRSWEIFFSSFQWMRWDESNFDLSVNAYVAEAYNARKFSYVSDYARLLALYRYGGVYLDVDCVVKRSFIPLLNQDAFTGFGGDNREIAACTMAFKPGHVFLKKCLDSYSADHFVNPDGSFNMKSINIRMTELLMTEGFFPDGKEQIVAGIHVYPMTYFCPLSMLPDSVADCKSKNTHSMTIWTDKSLLWERSLLVRIAHKIGLNKLVRSVIKK